jgi:hypothetical protein
MPAAIIKSFAKKSGKSEEEVEKLWKQTQEDVKNQFTYKTGAYWAYVNSIVQKKLKIEEATKITFKGFVELMEEDK